MITNSLVKKLIDGLLTFDEMIEFSQTLKKEVHAKRNSLDKDVDVSNLQEDIYTEENTFERYYSMQAIINMIEKHKKGEIDSNYLSLWSTVYTFIIMPAVWLESAKRDLYPIEVIEYKISDYLDILFFVEEYEDGMLDGVMNGITKADKIYHQLKSGYKFKIVFVSENQELHIVFIDENKKEYALFEMLVEDDKVIDANEVDSDKFADTINKLKEEQFVEI